MKKIRWALAGTDIMYIVRRSAVRWWRVFKHEFAICASRQVRHSIHSAKVAMYFDRCQHIASGRSLKQI